MKNKYEIRGEVTAVFVKSKKWGIREFLIDTEDLQKVNSTRTTWNVLANEEKWMYATCKNQINNVRKGVLLHRLIMNCPDGFFVDHINHNTLDNRKVNLRIVTKQENNQNLIGARKDNKSSGKRGVYFQEKYNVWFAKINFNNVSHHFGTFYSEAAAEKIIQSAISITMDSNLTKHEIELKLKEMCENKKDKSYKNNVNGIRNVYFDNRYKSYFVKIQKNKLTYSFWGIKSVEEASLLASTLRRKSHEELAASTYEWRSKHGNVEIIKTVSSAADR